MAVFVSSFVQAARNFPTMKEAEREARMMAKNMVKIIRYGEEGECHRSDLVVGDLLPITAEDELIVDGILVECSDLFCDESAMTGETELMENAALDTCIDKRNELQKSRNSQAVIPSPLLVSGTTVKQGSGLMIATCLGIHSAFGKAVMPVESPEVEQTPLSPLQQKVTDLSAKYTRLLVLWAILSWLTMVGRVICSYASRDGGWTSNDTTLIVQAFLIGITLVAVGLPNNLALTVTYTLANSVKRLLSDSNLVRKLNVLESLACIDTVITEKTGTLTLNKMFLTDFWNMQPISLSNNKHFKDFVQQSLQETFVQCLTCNSNDLPNQMGGSPTDQALLN